MFMKMLLLALPLLLAAPLVQAADPLKAVEAKIADMKGPDVKTVIETTNQQFIKAFNQGDSSAVAALYTDTATVLPPGGDMVVGHDALLAYWKTAIAGGMKLTKLTTVSVERHGGVAREIGRVSAEVPGADTTMVPIEGKYVVLWKDIKGVWKLDTDIWNLNK